MYFLLTMCQQNHYKYNSTLFFVTQDKNSIANQMLLHISKKRSHETGYVVHSIFFSLKSINTSTDKFYLNVILISFLLFTLLELLAIFTSFIVFCATITITGLFLPLSFLHLIKVRVMWLLMSPFIGAGSSL